MSERDEWFSDEALRKQAEVDRLDKAGKHVPFELIIGILEPRVPPTPEESCAHCGSDAREEVGGEIHGGRRWCWLCVSRERHKDDREIVTFEGNHCPRCGNFADDNWFDRSICPEPCDTMHTRCARCGCAIDGCPHETGRLRRA